MKHILIVLSLILTVLGCGTEILPKNEAISHENNKAFSINFPTSDWKLVNQQGIDSYVGYYERGTEKLYFDYGWYGGAANKEKAAYYEEVKLEKCGCNAIIAKETVIGMGTKLSALIFKENQQNRTKLYVWNPEDDQMFIKIFKTHVFK